MDYLKLGKSFRHYIYPPVLPKDEGIKPYKENLKEVIEKKLKDLLTRDAYVEKRKDEALKKIKKLPKDKSQEKAFLLELAASEYEEHFYNIKYQQYWLAVLDMISPAPPERKSTRVDVDRAKQFPIEQLYQGQLRQFGGKLSGLCPFHEERTPSFFIFPDNHYYCYGCGEHGDSIDFVMKTKGYEFVEAVKWMQ